MRINSVAAAQRLRHCIHKSDLLLRCIVSEIEIAIRKLCCQLHKKKAHRKAAKQTAKSSKPALCLIVFDLGHSYHLLSKKMEHHALISEAFCNTLKTRAESCRHYETRLPTAFFIKYKYSINPAQTKCKRKHVIALSH